MSKLIVLCPKYCDCEAVNEATVSADVVPFTDITKKFIAPELFESEKSVSIFIFEYGERLYVLEDRRRIVELGALLYMAFG